MQDAFDYIENDGVEVVVFDATNTTIDRRALLRKRVVEEKGFKLFFVESICDDEQLIDNNIRSVKVSQIEYFTTNCQFPNSLNIIFKNHFNIIFIT